MVIFAALSAIVILTRVASIVSTIIMITVGASDRIVLYSEISCMCQILV